MHTAAKSDDLVVRTVDAIDSCSASDVARDLALVRLDKRVSTEDFKPIHPPILGLTTLTSSPDCLAGKDQDHLTGTVVGYGDTDWNIDVDYSNGTLSLVDTYGNPNRERMYATSTGWRRDPGHYFKAFSIFKTYYGTLPGDSGGPWFTGGCLAGVNSAYTPEFNPGPAVGSEHTDLETPGNQTFLQDHILDESKTHFVGQCNPGDPNPWNDPKLENTDNGDHDGMPDACDPCPFDAYPDPQGNFSRGDDQDGDGVPDVCDNCPPSLCEQRGEPASDCYNPYPTSKFAPQADADGDGIGDVCDTCPTTPNHDANYTGPGVDDPDNDGVGAACDDCDKRNPVQPCTSDADCQYFPGDKNGFCIQIGKYGKCNDADGWACAINKGNAGCRDGVTCEYLGGSYGRCSQQLDDVNHNGVGGECDSCDSVKGNTILANSNDIRESIEGADALGDVCDPVPLYSTRMVLAPTEVSGVGGTTHPFDAYDPDKRTRFTATPGIGYDETKGGAAPPALTLTTGFRWTNCYDSKNPDPPGDLETCIKDHATENPTTGYNPPPGVQTTWQHITTKTYPYAPNQISAHNAFPGAGSDQTIQRTFTTSVSGDYEAHPYGSQEIQRVGAIENLLWDQATDIAANSNITTFLVPGDTTPHTVGALWSHVEDNGIDYASGRDQDFYDGAKGITNGGLRDNYAYVETPAVEQVLPIKLTCVNAPCYPRWSADLLVSPAETIISPASLVATSPADGLLTCSGGCSVVGPTGTADVTGAIVSPLDEDIQDPALEFVPAVERGYQVLHTGTATPGLMSVMMPRDWVNGSIPTSVVFDGRKVRLQSFIIGRPGVASAQIVPVGPGSRTAPAYTLSVKQSALYMAGGKLPSGAPAREIWRYDLLGQTWDRLVSAGGGALDDPAPFDVLAASYDPSQSQLAYVDQTTSVDDHGHATTVGRLVVVNTAPLSSRVALVLPRTGRLGRVFLTARGNGTWVLTADLGRGSAHAWIAYDFALDPDGNLGWNGWQTGQGAIVQQPLNSSNGVFLPVNHDGGTRFVRLEPSDFKHSGGKWDTL